MFQKRFQQQQKHPGRVASGKRLAERNRLAREAKKQAKAASATPSPDTSPEPTPASSSSSGDSSSNTYGYTVLAVGGLLVSAMGVYYQREAIMKTLGRNKAPAPPNASRTKGGGVQRSTYGLHTTMHLEGPCQNEGLREYTQKFTARAKTKNNLEFHRWNKKKNKICIYTPS